MQDQEHAVDEYRNGNGGAVVPMGAIPAGAGLEDFNMQEQGIIPRVTIVQPMTNDKGPAGTFYHNIHQTNTEAMRVVMLKFGQSRILFASALQSKEDEQRNGRDNRTLCVSRGYDADGGALGGRVPTGGVDIQAESCAQCKWARWGGSGGNQPPKCRLNFDLLCSTYEKHHPFILSVHGVSLQPVRKWVSLLKSSGKSAFSLSVMLDIEEKRGELGKYHQLRWSDPIWLDEVDPERRDMILADLRSQAQEHGHDEAWVQDALAEQIQKVVGAQLWPFFQQWKRYGGVELAEDPDATEAAKDAAGEVPF